MRKHILKWCVEIETKKLNFLVHVHNILRIRIYVQVNNISLKESNIMAIPHNVRTFKLKEQSQVQRWKL